MCRKKIQGICIFLSICMMIGIFCFSAKTAEVSAQESYQVGKWIVRLFVSDFETWPEETQDNYVAGIDFFVRKGAHASEYFVLAILLSGACLSLRNRYGKKYLLMPWAISTVYAMTDEFHQLFVPGRSGQLRDVGIDSLGAMLAVLFLLLCLQFYDWQRRHSPQE